MWEPMSARWTPRMQIPKKGTTWRQPPSRVLQSEDTGVSCTGLLSVPNRDLEVCVQCACTWKPEAEDIESRMRGAEPRSGGRGSCGWSWLAMVLEWQAKKSPLSSHRARSRGQFSQAHGGLEGAAGSLGGGVRNEEGDYGGS